MPKYRIQGSYGYVGTNWQDVVEADNEAEANEYAQERAMERVEYWAEEITDEEYNKEGGYK